MKLRKKAPILCVIGLIISLFGVSIGFEEPTSAIDCPAGQHSEIVARPNPNYPSTQISSEECIDDGETQITNQQNNGANETNQNNSDGTTENNNGGNSDDDDPASACYDSGVDSMGWVICPAIQNIENTTEGMLGIIENWLSVDPGDFAGQIQGGWSVFRNIANIVLAIFFLVIIFSQITGFGLNNYGIKKALPRLIVMAILINLSFILCVIAVDLSNIIGRGLANLLKAIGEGIGEGGSSLVVADIVDGILLLIGGGGVVAGLAAGQGAGGAVIIILLCLLVALVSIFMFFVMLSARMMAIIILTVISPVAFAMYALPNTQSLFNQWWKIIKGCLIVYPICGALYGTAYIIQGIAATNSDHFIWQMIAVVAPFIPFLTLPSLLKNAMAALGSFGAAIAMVGAGLRKGAESAKAGTMNSARFQEFQRRSADRAGAARAQRTMDRLQRRNRELGGTDDDYSALSRSQQRRLSEATQRVNANTAREAQDRVGIPVLTQEKALDRAMYARNAEERQADEVAVTNALNTMQERGIVQTDNDGNPILDAAGNQVTVAYDVNTASQRMEQLRDIGKNRQYTNQEKTEIAALSRGIAGMNGGGTKLSNIVRGAEDDSGHANTNFMQAMGEVYSSDSAVQSKLNSADVKASLYTEQFAPGATNSTNSNFNNFMNEVDTSTGKQQSQIATERIKTHEQGLAQSGQAQQEYIQSLGADATQDIINDEKTYKSMDIQTQRDFENHVNDLRTSTGRAFIAENQVLEHGNYVEEGTNAVRHLTLLKDGTARDDGGFRVDIKHYRKQSPSPTPTPPPHHTP